MNLFELSPGSVYSYPRYYAIGYQWDTDGECHFLEACLKAFGTRSTKIRMLDIGCGAGRHLLEMAKRGYQVTGFDLRPEMVAFVKEQAEKAAITLNVSVGDLHDIRVPGSFELAICLMDTFRYLLANDAILQHFKQVAQRLEPGGLYITDFWIPIKWDQIANEIYQWEQTRGDTTVRVFYVQHLETVNPVTQTFEDELVFTVQEGETAQEIHGERTRTRLIMPQEFRALIEASQAFDLMGLFSGFDLSKPLEASSATWRMVSVLKRRA